MLETNSTCNLSCSFCNRSELASKGLRNNKTLHPEAFKNILNVFEKSPIDTIKLQWLSEPMLNPSFAECAQLTREMFPQSFIITATNLQYDLESSPFFRSLPFLNLIYLSIDGIAETYETYRKGAKWSRLLQSLEQIKDHLKGNSEKEKIFINFVLTEFNYKELPDIYDLQKEYQLGGVKINLAQNWNEDQKNTHQFNQEVIDFLKKYKKDVQGVSDWDYKDCFWPFNGITVDVEGNVRQCVINTSQNPILNIFDQNFEQAFEQNKYYQLLRKNISQNKPGFGCLNCDYKFLAPILSQIFEGEELRHPRPIRLFKDPT